MCLKKLATPRKGDFAHIRTVPLYIMIFQITLFVDNMNCVNQNSKPKKKIIKISLVKHEK